MSGEEQVEAYIEGFPNETQEILRRVRATIREVVPEAEETISYAIPTFKLQGKNLVHFAGFAHHIGFYPTPAAITDFEVELASYKQGKGSVQFPLDRSIPYDLIKKMVESRVAEFNK